MEVEPSAPNPNAGSAKKLLAWYSLHRRDLPWRTKSGQKSDPYAVWLSEIMLQQTTVVAVAPYYRRFLKRWPSIGSLAAAPLGDVLAEWAGLGYYARARNLHRTARIVASERRGEFPTTVEELRRLPGIGTYTAGAVAAIAFGASEPAVDANAERVLARYFGVQDALSKVKSRLHELARSLLPPKRAGDFAQALMDLGALICTPKVPACGKCPWRRDCRARGLGIAETLPKKVERRPRPLKRGAAFVLGDRSGSILLERRPGQGLLGGMMQPPMTSWGDEFPSFDEAIGQAPINASWQRRSGVVRHGFTHFELEIEVYTARVRNRGPAGERVWMRPGELERAALPTLMRKILIHASRVSAAAAKTSL